MFKQSTSFFTLHLAKITNVKSKNSQIYSIETAVRSFDNFFIEHEWKNGKWKK